MASFICIALKWMRWRILKIYGGGTGTSLLFCWCEETNQKSPIRLVSSQTNDCSSLTRRSIDLIATKLFLATLIYFTYYPGAFRWNEAKFFSVHLQSFGSLFFVLGKLLAYVLFLTTNLDVYVLLKLIAFLVG